MYFVSILQTTKERPLLHKKNLQNFSEILPLHMANIFDLDEVCQVATHSIKSSTDILRFQ